MAQKSETMKMKRVLLTMVALIGFLGASMSVVAHGVSDIRINEVLVVNHDNFIDAYGHRVGWIELHNTGHSKVDVGGCYLTIYRDGEGESYLIPKGDPRTVIAPLGYIVFFAEGTATKGTFHTNFTLDQTGYLAFYDQSGKGKPVDEITYNVADQLPDVSIGVIHDENDNPVFKVLDTTTPMATNEEQDMIPPSERFRQMDPTGGIMAITAMTVVFSALLLLYLIFRTIGKLMTRSAKKKRVREEQAKQPEIVDGAGLPLIGPDIHGEELAAVAMAIYQYQNDLHDIESNVITINKVAKAYSPWSSKIYGLRQMPPKK